MLSNDYKNMVAPKHAVDDAHVVPVYWFASGLVSGVVISSLLWWLLLPNNIEEAGRQVSVVSDLAAPNVIQENAVPVKPDGLVKSSPQQSSGNNGEEKASVYNFYTELNQSEVIVAEVDVPRVASVVSDVKPQVVTPVEKVATTPVVEAKPVVAKGAVKALPKRPVLVARAPVEESTERYLLQVISYKYKKDAEHMRQRLLYEGIKTSVRPFAVNGRGVFYRLKTDAFSIEYINNLTEKLKMKGINPKVIRVK